MTYYTIIGKNLDLFKWHYNNVWNHAGLSQLPTKEFLVIIYHNSSIDQAVTQSIINFCNENGISFHLYEELTNDFITNLYNCWNLGYERAANDLIFRGGSDQAFSKNSFLYLSDAYEKVKDKKITLQANTVECLNRILYIGANSRHFTQNFGDTHNSFNIKIFDEFIEMINSKTNLDLLNIDQALEIWGHPTSLTTTLGNINRCDGCSWLMTREEWKSYGPLPTFENNITGDVVIHDKMQLDGYDQLIVKNCATYHLVQGERVV